MKYLLIITVALLLGGCQSLSGGPQSPLITPYKMLSDYVKSLPSYKPMKRAPRTTTFVSGSSRRIYRGK